MCGGEGVHMSAVTEEARIQDLLGLKLQAVVLGAKVGTSGRAASPLSTC